MTRAASSSDAHFAVSMGVATMQTPYRCAGEQRRRDGPALCSISMVLNGIDAQVTEVA